MYFNLDLDIKCTHGSAFLVRFIFIFTFIWILNYLVFKISKFIIRNCYFFFLVGVNGIKGERNRKKQNTQLRAAKFSILGKPYVVCYCNYQNYLNLKSRNL